MNKATMDLIESVKEQDRVGIARRWGFSVMPCTRGFTLEVGCKRFAIESQHDLMAVIEDLLINSEEITKNLYPSDAVPYQGHGLVQAQQAQMPMTVGGGDEGNFRI